MMRSDLENGGSLEEEIEDNQSPSEGVTLKKRMNVFLGAVFIVNYVVGSGIFVTPQLVVKDTGSLGLALIIWLAVGLIIITGAIMNIELGSMLPLAGGAYEHILIGLHRIAGFLFSWGYISLVTPTAAAAGAISFGNYLLAPFYPCGSPLYPKIILAIGAIWAFVFLNAFNIRTLNFLHKIFAGGKIATLTAVVIMGVVGAARGGYRNLEKPFQNTTSDPLSISLAFHSAVFTYSGWNGLNNLAEEMKNPTRTLPIASILGIGTVTVFYLLVNVSYMFVLTADEMKMSDATVVSFAEQLWKPLGVVFSILVALSILGFIGCELNATSRILYGAARRGHMPCVFRLLTISQSCPAVAVIAIGILATLYLAAEQVDTLVYMASFAEVSTYILLTATFFALRWRHPDLKRPFKAFIGCGVIFGLVLLAVLGISLVASPQSCAVAAAVIVGGIIFYPLVKYRKGPRFLKYYDVFTTTIERLFLSVASPVIPENVSVYEALKMNTGEEQ